MTLVVVFSLTLQKASDIVGYKILISKLENYGLRGTVLQWFESYLSNRERVVKISNVLSEKKYISWGVPQGSILGPILFLLHIHDIKNSSLILKFFLFADDTSTLLINKNIKEIEKDLQ